MKYCCRFSLVCIQIILPEFEKFIIFSWFVKVTVMSTKIADSSLDGQCIKFLELLAELEVKKQELENHMKNGFFHLAKARYAIGVNRVSKLSYPNTMRNLVAVDCSDVIDERFSLYKPLHMSDEDSDDDIKQLVRDELRKRHIDTVKSVDSVRFGSTENELESSRISITDPICWFSALAPQSLRLAQQSFSQALKESCDICNLQAQIEEVQKRYKDAQKKADLSS